MKPEELIKTWRRHAEMAFKTAEMSQNEVARETNYAVGSIYELCAGMFEDSLGTMMNQKVEAKIEVADHLMHKQDHGYFSAMEIPLAHIIEQINCEIERIVGDGDG